MNIPLENVELSTFLQHRSYKIVDILIVDNGQSYILNSNNRQVKMEDHVVLVKQWKKDQRLTKVQTEEERKEEQRKKKEEERMKKKEDAFDSYYQGKGEIFH